MISYHARTARCFNNILSYFIGSRYILWFLGAILEAKFDRKNVWSIWNNIIKLDKNEIHMYEECVKRYKKPLHAIRAYV